MRKLFLHLMGSGLLLISFPSCDSCLGVDCKVNENYNEVLRIVSARDGTDLVFGPGRQYEREKIRFFSIKAGDTTFFSFRPLKLNDNTPDSALVVNFFPKSDTAFMQLTATDVDTFALTHGDVSARCCVFNVVTSLRFNNVTDTLRGSPISLRK